MRIVKFRVKWVTLSWKPGWSRDWPKRKGFKGGWETLGPSASAGCCFSCSPLSYPQAWDFPRAKMVSVAQETPYYTVINFNFGALSHPLPMKNWRQEMYYHYFIHWQRASHLGDHIFSPRNPEYGSCGIWYVGHPMKRKNTRDLQARTCSAVPHAVLHSGQRSRVGSYQCQLRSPRNGLGRCILMSMTLSPVSNRNSWERNTATGVEQTL